MNDLLEIGKIVKLSGLKGRLKVLSYCESTQGFKALENVFVGKDIKHLSIFKVRRLHIKGRTFSLELEGVDTVETAGTLIGQSVFMTQEPLPDGEYYWKDIEGLEVVTEDGERLGRVTAILPTGSSDVYVCSGEEGEILLPAFEDVVREIDIENGRMVVRLPEGL